MQIKRIWRLVSRTVKHTGGRSKLCGTLPVGHEWSFCGRYLKRLAGKSRSQSIGPESECLALIRHSSDVVALSWTNSGDGVLVAGSEGDVTMYEISYQNRSAMELGEETIRLSPLSNFTLLWRKSMPIPMTLHFVDNMVSSLQSLVIITTQNLA